MKQILQNLKTGQLNIYDVPNPAIAAPGVIIATQASLISAGTEKMLVDFANKGFIAKAKSRPKDVQKIIEKLKRDGLRATIQSVLARLDVPMPLGYSSAGIVLAVSPDVTNVRPGDRVACGGSPHAEVIFAPKNLVVPMPDNLDFESAAFATLGCIAMQGIRVAQLELGEKVAVIGLGLLGLITIQIARAAGCRVIGSDINPDKLAIAGKLGCDCVCAPEQLINEVGKFTDNYGADAVIVTAAASSNVPIEQAAEICRKKGRISVVGAVKMDIPRTPFYKKELQLRLSMSYGPGRYDTQYEEKGIDYPQAYVPWTEQRNMASVLDLMAQGKLNVKELITHKFDIEQAEQAYKIIRGEIQEKYIGIILTYPEYKNRQAKPEIQFKSREVKSTGKEKICVGVIGVGNFATMTLLPAIKNINQYYLRGVSDVKSDLAQYAKNKFGFDYASGDYKEILNDSQIDLVFICTRHNSHSQLTIESLQAGKNVLVEKPLCLNEQELAEVIKEYEKNPNKLLMLGFNRRFAPIAIDLKERFKNKGPHCINYICNAGFTPKDEWTQDPNVGGGRIIGEACHFIDWMSWFTDSMPVKVYAQSITKENAKAFACDNVMISIQFENGSIGTVSYLASGNKSFTKEHIEIYGAGQIGILDDYRKAIIISNSKKTSLKGSSKGHFQQWQQVANSLKNGQPQPISFEQIVASTWATLKAIESLNTGLALEL